ncbi:protein FAM221A isoform X2 [Nelusetta ayraudi]|uniref:protein FAM221A isoform X2 n=1 Tax=Nelusetta ayraudi TaxID=303726 RepID=UPI003F710BF7
MELVRLPSVLGAINSYLEYKRIVGDDDGGTLFTPEQYEAYKKKMVPLRLRNRLYVSYGVPGGRDCKAIGPDTPCFCTHRYKQHQTDFEEVPTERPLCLPCRAPGCKCTAYNYVPQFWSTPVRCKCKHLPRDHSEVDAHPCKKCISCTAFRSTFTCTCTQPSSSHRTLVETKSERVARGRPVGWDVPYAAMGGLVGFSSLLEGHLGQGAAGSGSDGDGGRQWCCPAPPAKDETSKP